MISNLEFLLHNTSEALSRLVWQTLCGSDKKVLRARFRPNQHLYTVRTVAHWSCCGERLWVPQNNGRFVRPLEASRASLPKGFPVDEGYEWLNAVHFGENERQRSEAYRQQTGHCAGARLSRRGVAERRESGTPISRPETDNTFKMSTSENNRLSFLNVPPPTPELRAKRVAEQAEEAPERITEKRMQSVSVGREAVKQETEPYLKKQYTNPDGEMFCQVCKAPLPFKFADGNYYFEMVEFLREPDLQKRHYQNYLLLCPNHAAMYKHANGSREGDESAVPGDAGT